MCAENDDLTDVRIFPINGSFDKFPRTILFTGEHDVTYPDQLLVVQKLKKSDIDIIKGEGMPHIWPLLPVVHEAKVSLEVLISELSN